MGKIGKSITSKDKTIEYSKWIFGVSLIIIGILLFTRILEFKMGIIISSLLGAIVNAIECFEVYKDDKQKLFRSGTMAFLWGMLFVSGVFLK